MSKLSKVIVLSVVIVVALAAFWFLRDKEMPWQNRVGPDLEQPADVVESNNSNGENVDWSGGISVGVTIDDFNPGAVYALKVKKDATVLNVLEQINQEQPELNLQIKTYEGLGALVERLGTHTNGEDKKYWQYFVNGEQPMVSADKYILKNNDKIEWRFAASEF